MTAVRVLLGLLAVWGALLSVGLLSGRLPASWLAPPAPQSAAAPAVAACACELAAVKREAKTAAEPEKQRERVIDAALYPLCPREEGAPALSAVRLARDASPLWALHCGPSVQLLSIERDGERFAPRRVAVLRAPSDGPSESARAAAVQAGDVDGDGLADLLAPVLFVDRTGAPTGGALHLLRQRPEGGFATPTRMLDLSPGGVVAATLDAERGKDLALLELRDTHTARPSELWLLHGGPSPLRFAQLPAGVGASAIAGADLDRDGLDDVAVVSARENRVRVWLSAHAAPGHTEPVTFELKGVREVVAGDLDGDGHADLVLAGERLWVLLAAEGASPEPRELLPGTELREIQIADVDQDGKPDLVGYAHPEVVALRQGPALSFERHRLARLQGDVSVRFARVAQLDETKRLDLLILAVSGGPDPQIELGIAEDIGSDTPVRLAAAPSAVREEPLLQRFTLR